LKHSPAMDLTALVSSAQDLLEEDEEEEELIHDLLFQRRPPGVVTKRRRGGSQPGRSPNKRRNYHERHVRLLEQYFGPFPVYSANDFRRRFRMRQQLFHKVMTAVTAYDSFFEQKQDAAGRVSISSLLKVTSALRVLAYASSFDSIDENLEMSETTIRSCVQHFCDAVISIFAAEYLRPPTPSELKGLLIENAKRGFIGMVGSIDCMDWTWKNSPMAIAGQHKGKEKKPSKVLEAVADYKLRIWHYNFGSPGSLNDLNILEQSSVFDALLRGEAATVQYEINGTVHTVAHSVSYGTPPR